MRGRRRVIEEQAIDLVSVHSTNDVQSYALHRREVVGPIEALLQVIMSDISAIPTPPPPPPPITHQVSETNNDTTFVKPKRGLSIPQLLTKQRGLHNCSALSNNV